MKDFPPGPARPDCLGVGDREEVGDHPGQAAAVPVEPRKYYMREADIKSEVAALPVPPAVVYQRVGPDQGRLAPEGTKVVSSRHPVLPHPPSLPPIQPPSHLFSMSSLPGSLAARASLILLMMDR